MATRKATKTTKTTKTTEVTTRLIVSNATRATLKGKHTFTILSITTDKDKNGNDRQIFRIETTAGIKTNIFVTHNASETGEALLRLLDAYKIDDLSELEDAELTATFATNKGFTNIKEFSL